MVCKNCEATFEGKFCSNCGQKADVHRITIKHLFHELFHAVTHADKGILLLAKSLITRPGHIAREYIDGKRKTYFNPLSFLVITAAISAYVIHAAGYYEAMSYRPQSAQTAEYREPPSEGQLAFFKLMSEMGKISMNNEKVLELLLIFPLMAFFTWLLFGRKKANFAENLVLSSFIMGQFNIVMTVFFIPAFLLAKDTAQMNNNVSKVFLLIYMTIAYRQFFKQNIFLTILKAALVIVLYILFFWAILVGYILIRDQIIGH